MTSTMITKIKLLVLAATTIAATAFPCRAQFTAGVEAGFVSSYNEVVSSTAENDVEMEGFSPGNFQAGIYGGYGMAPSWSLYLHAGYRSTRARASYGVRAEGVGISVEERAIWRNIDLSLRLLKTLNRFGFGIGAGVNFHKWTSSELDYSVPISPAVFTYDIKEYVNKAEGGVLPFAEASIRYGFSERMFLFARAIVPFGEKELRYGANVTVESIRGEVEDELDAAVGVRSYGAVVGLQYRIW